MKKRLKQALCLVSALVVMCVSFVLPASADFPASDFPSDYFAFRNFALKQYSTMGYDFSDYKCVITWNSSITSSGSAFAFCYFFAPDTEFNLGYPRFSDNGALMEFSSSKKFTVARSFIYQPENGKFACYYERPYSTTYMYSNEISYSHIEYLVYSDFDFYYNGEVVKNADKDPSAPVTPFTVSYSPALKEGMSRKGILSAPGASNDGEEIESNGLNVRVTLTDEFIKLRDSYDELKDYSYEFICYITTAPPEKTSYKESLENAVYTSLDYGKYMYTTSGVVKDVTDDNEEPAQWIKAEGINAGNIISKGGTTKNVTINLENLDSSKFTDDTKLYIVVYGRLTSLSVPTPDYFDLDNQGYLCNQGSLNTKQIVTVNADPETGEGTDVTMPDYYCVTSDVFSYKDYPEYKPKIFKNGAEMDTNKPTTDYMDKKITPDYMYDYDMDKKGESGLAPDDFKKYEEQKKLDKNFGSFDFSLTGISDIFDGSSDFFNFLTASIAILPTTFLTVLISFFVLMLAICVVKWVL